MNHLKAVTIKPHLRRTRSHTSPSPGRPPTFSTDLPTTQVLQAGSGKAQGLPPTSSPNNDSKVSLDEKRTPRASIDSQRHSRLPHLHLHTHHPQANQGRHIEETSKRDASGNTGVGIRVPESKTISTDKSSGMNGQPSTYSKNGITAKKLDPSPTSNGHRHHLSHHTEHWPNLAPEHHHLLPSLHRSHSHRSTSQLNNPKDDLLTPTVTNSSRPYGTTPTSPNRPRATSDSTRPALTRGDLSTVSIGPTASSSGIALALDKADRRREIKLLSATPADVARLDREAAAATTEMRDHLIQVEKEGMEITRRLDYAYYGLLERIGDLYSVVGQFQSLRLQTIELGTRLEKEIKSLDEEIRHNIASLKSNVESYRFSRVESLEQRMRAGREKAAALSDRLEAARHKLHEWETRDQEWRNRIGRRLKVSWICVLTMVLVGLFLIGMRGMRQTSQKLDEMGLGGHLGPGARFRSSRGSREWMERIKLRHESSATGPYTWNGTIDPDSELGRRLKQVYIPEDVLSILGPVASPSSNGQTDGSEETVTAAATTPTAKRVHIPFFGSREQDNGVRGEDIMRAFDDL